MNRIRLTTLLALLLAFIGPSGAFSGGWASIRLDGPIPPAYVEVPWTIGFTVLQHDVRPINLEAASLRATHRESGETLAATAAQVGETGHYRVEAVFPRAGDWSWRIEISPFSGTSFGTLHVAEGPSTAASQPPVPRSMSITEGTCSSLGVTQFQLSEPQPAIAGEVAELGGAARVSVTTLDESLPALLASQRVISVRQQIAEAMLPVACGQIAGDPATGEVAIAIQPVNGATSAGIALLHGGDHQTVVTVYLFDLPAVLPPAPVAGGPQVLIVDSGSGPAFSPAHLEIPAGSTVTWINQSAVPHTVTFGLEGLEDSGMLMTGQTFSQTFATPGTYAFHCDPHPWMTGTIVVTQ